MAFRRYLLLLLLFFLSQPLSSWAWLSTDPAYGRPRTHHGHLSPVASVQGDAEDAERLRQQAEKLRREVESFEQEKAVAEQAEKDKIQQEIAIQQATRERYSAVVPILKPDGSTVEERCDFSPRYKEGGSFITTVEASLPLGILLGESDDMFPGTRTVLIDEIASESNGEMAGLQEGDIIRAFTACRAEMEQPTWQLLAGGIGVPKMKRFMYSADNRPLEEVLDAIGSNRMDPDERPVLIVVERREGKS